MLSQTILTVRENAGMQSSNPDGGKMMLYVLSLADIIVMSESGSLQCI